MTDRYVDVGSSALIKNSTRRIAHLDGLRGLAALYVVLHHAYVEVAWTKPSLPAWLTPFTRIFEHGTLAVDVFIVLSGFVLMMPVLVSAAGSLRDGLIAFFKRRARRILPAYYGALAISLLLIAFVPQLANNVGDRWDAALPAWSAGPILSHLLLVHNLSRDWIWKIDNPMWSVATEWQIYFIFALLLLPVWRRLGMLAAVCLAMTCGAIIEFFMPGDSEACFHFIGLFGFGMAAAHAVTVARPRTAYWNLISSTLCLGLIGAIAFFPPLTRQPKIVVDLIVGTVTAIVITGTASLESVGKTGLLNRVLGAPPLRKLGEFSYSLYLMHFPLIALGHKLLHGAHLSPIQSLLAMMLLVVPVAVLACWVFHRIFERPFLRSTRSDFDAASVPAERSDNMRLAA